MSENHSRPRIVTVTVSDTRTEATDEGGRILRHELEHAGFEVVRHVIVPDESENILALIDGVRATREVDAIVLTGGTGISPRDCTYEAVSLRLDRTLEGFGEAFRRLSWDQIGPRSILSRAIAGTFDTLLIFSLPGSVKAVKLAVESLIAPTLAHAIDLVNGRATHAAQTPPASRESASCVAAPPSSSRDNASEGAPTPPASRESASHVHGAEGPGSYPGTTGSTPTSDTPAPPHSKRHP